MIIVNVNGNYFLKENDTATEIRLRIEDSQGNALDLSTAPRLEVVIGNNQGRILTKTPKLMSATGELEFGLDEGDVLPVGDNNLEVHIFTDAGERHVAPSKGYYRLRVQRAIDSTEVEITTYSLTYFIDEVNRITAGLPELVEQGNEIAERLEQMLDDSEGLVEETNLALAQSQESRDLAAQALVDAAQAGANAIAAEEAAVRANDAADRAAPAAIRAEGAAEAAEQAKIDADAATAAANLATEAANVTVTDLIGYNRPIDNFNIATSYLKNQAARFNGSTFRARENTQGNPLPVAPAVQNQWWNLEAQRGVDGSGAVSAVAGILPGADGDVVLTPQDIGALGPEHLQDQVHKHVEVVTSLPTDFTGRGVLFSQVGNISDAPERPSYDKLVEELAIVQESVSDVRIVLGVKNDGTQDISAPLAAYASTIDEIYLHFPPGKYRWDNNTALSNKKIKFTGDNAVIEHYGPGTNLDIGSVTAKATTDFLIQGIDFVNKRPKPATGGSGVTSLQISDCFNTTIRDVNVYDSEQYGINLRRSNGDLVNVTIDNVKIFGVSGTLGTTTSIALETRASSSDGRIKNLKITNSYFEVVDSYVNSVGGTTNVALSNASKLQAVDNLEIVNVIFKGGKENGTLTLSYDTTNVKMSNVTCISDSLASKGLTITLCPNLELSAVNCDLGINNFSQSIGVSDTVKEARFIGCRLQRITKVSGNPSNFKFDSCTFYLPTSALTLTLQNSQFNNCSIDNSSPVKNVFVLADGSNIRFNNFTGIGSFEISGNNIEVIGGRCESIRPNASSSKVYVKGIRATSTDRAVRSLTSTVSDWTFEGCSFEKPAGGASGVGYVQGTRMIFNACSFSQIDKTATVPNSIIFANSTDCMLIEKRNMFDTNKTGNNISTTASTGFKQYEIGDTFVNANVPQIWNGTAFVNI